MLRLPPQRFGWEASERSATTSPLAQMTLMCAEQPPMMLSARNACALCVSLPLG